MNLNEPTSAKGAIPTQPGLYKLSFLSDGEPIFTFEGSMESFLEEAKLWRRRLQDRVLYCDQCDYLETSAQAVQEHSQREHDCRYTTYEDSKGQIRVRTLKCHERRTVPVGAPGKRRMRA